MENCGQLILLFVWLNDFLQYLARKISKQGFQVEGFLENTTHLNLATNFCCSKLSLRELLPHYDIFQCINFTTQHKVYQVMSFETEPKKKYFKAKLSFVRSFLRSLVRSFVHSFVRSFIHSWQGVGKWFLLKLFGIKL